MLLQPKAMRALKVNTNDDKRNKNIMLRQEIQFAYGGTNYAKSGGTYDQAINVADGLVIAYYIYSPRHEAKVNSVQGEVTPLNQYSVSISLVAVCFKAVH